MCGANWPLRQYSMVNEQAIPSRPMSADFDVDALYQALDSQRSQRGLTWAQAMRQINDTYRDVDLRPVAASTIT